MFPFEVKSTKSAGLGLFATRNVEPGFILPYTGVVKSDETHYSRDYCFSLSRLAVGLVLDANPDLPELRNVHPNWTTAARINEATLVAPNSHFIENPWLTESDIRLAQKTGKPIVGSFSVTSQPLKRGDELLTQYGHHYSRSYPVWKRSCLTKIDKAQQYFNNKKEKIKPLVFLDNRYNST